MPSSFAPLPDEVFAGYQRLAESLAGIRLDDTGKALLQNRLRPLLSARRTSSENEYLTLLRRPDEGDERLKFLEAITTGFTGFFRDPVHFSRVQQAVEAAIAGGQRRFRFWSCASATGEEPYSLAMVLEPLVLQHSLDCRILATDISGRVLEQAQAGFYSEASVASTPAPHRATCFERVSQGPKDKPWRLSQSVRQLITFRQLNLAQMPFAMHGPLDAVFARNVMYYLQLKVRRALVGEIERLLRPGGLLFLGAAETLHGVPTGLVAEECAVFHKALAGEP